MANTVIKSGLILAAHPVHNRSEYFDKSVVLITEHSQSSTVGLVINKPYVISQNEIFAGKGIDTSLMDDRPVYAGGPVNTGALILLHNDDWFSSNTKRITDGLAMSSDLFMLEKITTGNQPRIMRWIAGMSGWQPNQLTFEINGEGPWKNRPQWLPVPFQKGLIFKTQGESLWRKIIDLHASYSVETFF